MKDDILIGDTPKAVRRRARVKAMKGSGQLWKHSGLADIHGLVTGAEIADFFVTTLVRNPWDRMVSYYHWLQVQNWEHPAVGLAKSLNFKDFIDHPETRRSITGADYPSYVTDINNVERCDLFIRIEHLTDDLGPFEHHLGFSLGQIEHINVSERHSDYRRYYDDNSAAVVAEICAADIARFGYQFQAARLD